MVWLPDGEKNFEDRPMFIHFYRIHERDEQTDGLTDIASRGKNDVQA